MSESHLEPSILDAAIEEGNPSNKPEPAVAEPPPLWGPESIAESLRHAEGLRGECDRLVDNAEADIARIDQRLPRELIDRRATEIRLEAANAVYAKLGALVEVGRQASAQKVNWTHEAVELREADLVQEERWSSRLGRMGSAELVGAARQAVSTDNRTLASALRQALNSRKDLPGEVRQQVSSLLAKLPPSPRAAEQTRKLQQLRYLAELSAIELSARLRQRRADPLDRLTVHRRYAPTF